MFLAYLSFSTFPFSQFFRIFWDILEKKHENREKWGKNEKMDFGHFDINFDLDCSNGFRHVYWLYLSPIGAFKKIFLPKGRLQPSWAWFWERRQSNPHRQSVQSKGLQNPLIWSKIGIWEAKKRVVRTKKFSEFFVFTFLIPYFHTLPCLFLAQRGFVYFLCQ